MNPASCGHVFFRGFFFCFVGHFVSLCGVLFMIISDVTKAEQVVALQPPLSNHSWGPGLLLQWRVPEGKRRCTVFGDIKTA
jgi:hypothetical protein